MCGSEPAEVIAAKEEEALVEAMRPVDVGVDAQSVGLIDEAEQIAIAGPRALKVEAPIELVPAAERLVQARKKRILMAAVENGYLVVVKRSCR